MKQKKRFLRKLEIEHWRLLIVVSTSFLLPREMVQAATL